MVRHPQQADRHWVNHGLRVARKAREQQLFAQAPNVRWRQPCRQPLSQPALGHWHLDRFPSLRGQLFLRFGLVGADEDWHLVRERIGGGRDAPCRMERPVKLERLRLS